MERQVSLKVLNSGMKGKNFKNPELMKLKSCSTFMFKIIKIPISLNKWKIR